MSEYDLVFSAAVQLPVFERLRLIDELASSVPEDQPPSLSAEWLTEIDKRADELATGRVKPDSWDDVKTRLQRIVGNRGAN